MYGEYSSIYNSECFNNFDYERRVNSLLELDKKINNEETLQESKIKNYFTDLIFFILFVKCKFINWDWINTKNQIHEQLRIENTDHDIRTFINDSHTNLNLNSYPETHIHIPGKQHKITHTENTQPETIQTQTQTQSQTQSQIIKQQNITPPSLPIIHENTITSNTSNTSHPDKTKFINTIMNETKA